MSQRMCIKMKQMLCFSALCDEHQEDGLPTFSTCWMSDIMMTTSILVAALLGDKVPLHSDSTVGRLPKGLYWTAGKEAIYCAALRRCEGAVGPSIPSANMSGFPICEAEVPCRGCGARGRPLRTSRRFWTA